MPALRHFFLALLTGSALLLTACQTGREEAKAVPRFYVEVLDANQLGNRVQVLEMPGEAQPITVQTASALNETHFARVQVVQVDLGRALMFETTSSGAFQLMRVSTTNIGRRLVLVVGEEVIGMRRIDGSIQNGVLYTFVFEEEDETSIFELADRINKALARANR
ncbi:MAG: hypothetical protein ACOCVG_02620 [Verrucomicrobiota bacterium]